MAKGKMTARTAVFPLKVQIQRPEGRAAGRSRALLHFAFCTLPFAFALYLESLIPSAYYAQAPYAAINRDAVSYNGPGREAANDLPGTEIRIGLLLPLTGPRRAEGETLHRAAQMAVDEENAASPSRGHRLLLVARDESGPWGQASTEVAHLVFDDQAAAIITSPEGSSAHLAEQVANRIGVPVLTLASDSTTTEINLPWIFRIGPTDAAQAQAFARDLYQNRKLERVLLLTQDDHDGRLGGGEFVKAARAISSTSPTQIVVGAEPPAQGTLRKEVEGAQAVVVWGDTATVGMITKQIHDLRSGIPLYLCRKAAEGEGSGGFPVPCTGCDHSPAGRWMAAPPPNRPARDEFNQRYRRRFGSEPSSSAAEAYDAVRILAASLRKSGPNRVRLRDALAEVTKFAGASGFISFDHAGNDLSQTVLLHLD